MTDQVVQAHFVDGVNQAGPATAHGEQDRTAVQCDGAEHKGIFGQAANLRSG